MRACTTNGIDTLDFDRRSVAASLHHTSKEDGNISSVLSVLFECLGMFLVGLLDVALLEDWGVLEYSFVSHGAPNTGRSSIYSPDYAMQTGNTRIASMSLCSPKEQRNRCSIVDLASMYASHQSNTPSTTAASFGSLVCNAVASHTRPREDIVMNA